MKKIFAEEILNDEELEKVSGGGLYTHIDMNFLYELGYKRDETYKERWARAGVTYNEKGYFIGDKEVSRKEAYIHAMKERGWNDTAIQCFNWEDYYIFK